MPRTLVLAAALTLAACGGEAEQAPRPTPVPEPAETLPGDRPAPEDELEEMRALGREEAHEALAAGLPWVKEFGQPGVEIWVDDTTGLPVDSLGCVVMAGQEAWAQGWNDVIREAARGGRLDAYRIAERMRPDEAWHALFDEDTGQPIAEFAAAWEPPDGVRLALVGQGHWQLSTNERAARISDVDGTTVRLLDDGRTLALRSAPNDTAQVVEVYDVLRGYCFAWTHLDRADR